METKQLTGKNRAKTFSAPILSHNTELLRIVTLFTRRLSRKWLLLQKLARKHKNEASLERTKIRRV